jgi:hypothetical protein
MHFVGVSSFIIVGCKWINNGIHFNHTENEILSFYSCILLFHKEFLNGFEFCVRAHEKRREMQRLGWFTHAINVSVVIQWEFCTSDTGKSFEGFVSNIGGN